MKKAYSRLLAAAALSLAPLAQGCNQDRAGARADFEYAHGNFEGAEKTLKVAAKKTDENYVLNNARLGSVAMVDYDLDTAETAFLRAYEVINSAGVNDSGRQFSAVVVGENQKIWKGEPFERAMVNYYLGLLYYMQGDFNNSRAAFENALFKLRDYGDSDHADQYAEFESDFALGYLMLGKCYQHLGRGDKAGAMFAQAAKVRPDLAPVAGALAHEEDNVLLIADYGWGPKKITNVDHAFVGFAPTPERQGPIPLPEVLVDGQPTPTLAPPCPTVDLLALAQDRKWQDIDTIRAVKSIAGKGLMAVGAYETAHGAGFTGHRTNGGDIAAGLGILAAGALLDASSQADLRQWEQLPRSVFVLPLRLAPGTHDVTVAFPTGEHQTWHGLTAPDKGETTYYYRMLPNAPPDRVWPPRYLAGKQPPTAGSTPSAGSPPSADNPLSPSGQSPPPPVAQTPD